ncbi:DHS-like NAD/FAD-binding domain-containing protein [Myriangium duriaei CBS 260.36]|uniref:DHS-like NAD/FAD-binding domain-containing protein n=1 Tax=Myriangium duriaei CBS 260.36 TaxID=1168546 RepID=A0A9P4JBT4_9PEZI|nr:DHS-like NAD/FAD-binding domain-containing protein [Myriangium duriaei CBS 260.36]
MAFDDSSILSDCSSPLSSLASSPSPPPDMMPLSYPSPPASQDSSDAGSPCPDGMESTIVVATGDDGPPPAKKRKISDRKSRSTEYLDLKNVPIADGQKAQLDKLMKVLHKRRKIVVVAGAGISVSAGIPDFRSSTGLFTSLRSEYNLKGSGKHLFDASVYKDESSTSSFHDMIKQMSKMTKDAKPTPFHHMLATLAQDNRLLRLYTQNVDGIDTSMEPLATTVPLKKSAGKWPKTVQLHGGLDKMVCSKCSTLSDFDADLFDGPMAPICAACVELDRVRTDVAGKRSHGIGRLRPRMVLYNEHNPDDEAIGNVVAEDLRKRPDAIIVVGTSLKIPGVKRIVREMCATVRDRRDGVAIWVNNDPEPVGVEFKDCWDIVVRGTCDEVARHAALRRWYEMDSSVEPTPEQWEEAIKTEAQVVINRTFKPIKRDESFRSSTNSPEYSPMATRTSSIFDSDSLEGDEVAVGAPPTPSKSVRCSPTKVKGSAFDAMDGKRTTVAAKARKNTSRAAPAKARGRPSVKGQKMVNKAGAKGITRITQTMTQSKSFASNVGKDNKPAQKRGRSRSKVDPVMLPVPPENARVNSISSSDGGVSLFPDTVEEPVKKRMSLERVMNEEMV